MSQRLPGEWVKSLANSDDPRWYSLLPAEISRKGGYALTILNAVVNLQFRAPAASTAYVMHAMYLYNASLLCSRGSAEYIF